MITINDLSIIENGTKLSIDVETTVGYFITSILLWDMNSFKDYTLSTSLNYKLEQVNNKEIIIVTAEELGITSFEDIWFIEVESDAPAEECSTCQDPALGITYNLYQYYKCSLAEFLKVQEESCLNCKMDLNKNLIMDINLLIESVITSIELGFYSDAISSVNKLKKLCALNSQCAECKQVECSTCSQFKQFV